MYLKVKHAYSEFKFHLRNTQKEYCSKILFPYFCSWNTFMDSSFDSYALLQCFFVIFYSIEIKFILNLLNISYLCKQSILQTLMDHYRILSKLGEGAFSVVFKVKRLQDNLEYAMKKVKVMNLNDQELSHCLNEVRILASIQDNHILCYRDSFYDELTKNFCIVTDYLEGGDLSNFIQKMRKKKERINEQMIWDVGVQILKGLKSLHDANILHRDVKPANIFIDKDFKQIKLGDMNLSIVSTDEGARTQAGTPFYTSPEVWSGTAVSIKCDIWSLGCVLYEMAALKPPFISNNAETLKGLIEAGTVKRIPNEYSKELWSLIKNCLAIQPRDRPSAKQLLDRINLKFTKNIFEISSAQKCDFQLFDKIRAPRRADFRIIRRSLPKHRFLVEKFINDSNELEWVNDRKEHLSSVLCPHQQQSIQVFMLPKLKEWNREAPVLEPKEKRIIFPQNRNLRA